MGFLFGESAVARTGLWVKSYYFGQVVAFGVVSWETFLFSKENGGLGMGLIIVKETLKALGMKLSITNTHPTQFCIEIPLENKND